MATSKLKHYAFSDVLTMTKAEVPVFLVGPAGTGKTTIGENVANEMKLDFYYAGSVESPFQLRGFMDANGRLVKTPFRNAYENGGLFLFDELDASDPQAIVTVHAALDNGLMDCPDGMVKRHKDFRFIAAGNTWGHGASLDYVGRNALDGATLDRYAFMHVDYDTDLEIAIAKTIDGKKSIEWARTVQHARLAVQELELRHIVSTRAIRDGAKLIKVGISADDAFERTVTKGLPADDAIKVRRKMEGKISDLEKSQAKISSKVASASKLLTRLKGINASLEQAEGLLARAQKVESRLSAIEGDLPSINGTRKLTEAAKKIAKYVEAAKSLGKIGKVLEGVDVEKSMNKAQELAEIVVSVQSAIDNLLQAEQTLGLTVTKASKVKAQTDDIEATLIKARPIIDKFNKLVEGLENSTGIRRAALEVLAPTVT